jgi:hypothetical protein
MVLDTGQKKKFNRFRFSLRRDAPWMNTQAVAGTVSAKAGKSVDSKFNSNPGQMDF